MGCGGSTPAEAGGAASAPEKRVDHAVEAKAEQIEKTEEEQSQDLEQEAQRIAMRYADAPAAECYAGKASDLLDDLNERRERFQEAMGSLTGNDGLVAAAELARLLFPAPFELVDSVCSAVAASITEGVGKVFQLAPPPLDAALMPLGKALGAVVEQMLLVKANKKAAQQLSERVIQAARAISELLHCIGRAKHPDQAGERIKSDVEQLTQLLVGEGGALPFLKRFCDRGYLAKMWKGKTDKAKFEELDSGILDSLTHMDEAVGRQTLFMVTHIYDMVEQSLEVAKETRVGVDKLNDKADVADAKLSELLQRVPHTSNATDRKIWLEVAIDPPPGLHIGGQSRLAGVMRRTNGIHELLEQKHSLENLRQQRNLPIRFADSKSLPTSICAAQVVLWLSLGSDCLRSSEGDVEHVKAALNAMDQIHRPQLLIVCMKYGAERVGEALGHLVPVIWMTGDLVSTSSGLASASHQFQCVAKTVVPTLHKLLGGQPRLSLVDAAHEIKQSSARCIEQAGAVGELRQDMDSQQGLAKSDPPFLRTFDADCFQDVTCCKVEELLSQDIEHVKRIRQQLEKSDDPRIHLVSEGTNAHERLRSVALHVLETLADSKYSSIIRVDEVATLKEKQIKNSTLMWLDLYEAPGGEDQKLLGQRLKKLGRKCTNLAVLLTTERDWGADAPFERIAICAGDGKCSLVSELHEDLPISYQSKSEGSVDILNYCTRSGLSAMIERAVRSMRKAYIAGAFEGSEKGELVLRVCVSDVSFLHELRDRILQGDFATMLTKAAHDLASGADRGPRRMSTRTLAGALEAVPSTPAPSVEEAASPKPARPVPDGEQTSGTAEELPAARLLPMPKDLELKVDFTTFAERYESLIYKLDTLTPHQRQVHSQLTGQDHIVAAAGSGKTFLALHTILQDHLLRDTQPTGDDTSSGALLFVANAEPLALTLIKWLYLRLVHVHGKQKDEAETLLEQVHVLFPPLAGGPRACSFAGGRIVLKANAAAPAVKYALVVVDEAHRVYSNPELASAVTRLTAARMLLLSDASQKNGREKPTYPEGLSKVHLTEVVRSSERIFAAASAFQLHNDGAQPTTSLHQLPGPPLQPFLFELPADASSEQRISEYARFTEQALQRVQEMFEGMSLHDRVAIIGPDCTFCDALREPLKQRLEQGGPTQRRFELVSAAEACAIIGSTSSGAGALIFDPIEQLDGLERLIVVAVGLDAPLTDDQGALSGAALDTRSRLYRALMRAHMLVLVVNEALPDGMLTYVQRLQLDADEKNTKMETNTAAAQKLEEDVEEQEEDRAAARKRAAAETGTAMQVAAAGVEAVEVRKVGAAGELGPGAHYDLPFETADEEARAARAAAEKAAAGAAEANKAVVQGVWAGNACKIVVQRGELTFNPAIMDKIQEAIGDLSQQVTYTKAQMASWTSPADWAGLLSEPEVDLHHHDFLPEAAWLSMAAALPRAQATVLE